MGNNACNKPMKQCQCCTVSMALWGLELSHQHCKGSRYSNSTVGLVLSHQQCRGSCYPNRSSASGYMYMQLATKSSNWCRHTCGCCSIGTSHTWFFALSTLEPARHTAKRNVIFVCCMCTDVSKEAEETPSHADMHGSMSAQYVLGLCNSRTDMT